MKKIIFTIGMILLLLIVTGCSQIQDINHAKKQSSQMLELTQNSAEDRIKNTNKSIYFLKNEFDVEDGTIDFAIKNNKDVEKQISVVIYKMNSEGSFKLIPSESNPTTITLKTNKVQGLRIPISELYPSKNYTTAYKIEVLIGEEILGDKMIYVNDY